MDKRVEVKEDGEGGGGGYVSSVPANAMGGSSSTAGRGGIDTYDPLLMKNKKKKLREIIRRKNPNE